MSSPDERRRGAVAATGGSTAAGGTPRGRRPWWAWLVLALVAVAIIVVILLLATQCGTGSGTPAGPPGGTPAAAPGAPPAAGAPGAPPAAGAPGAPPAGAPAGAPPSDGAAETPPAGAPSGGAAGGDVAGLSSRLAEIQAGTPVTFRPDSAELTTAGQESVDRIGRELAAVPAARVQVTGYAAPVSQGVGPAAQALSDQRAAAVAQRLGVDGLGADRVQARGAADTNPQSSTAASRRAEVAVS